MSDLRLVGEPASGSPFDSIKQVREDGSEYWSARDLMGACDYDRWENFAQAVERARIAARNQNLSLEHHFRDATKVIEGGRWGTQTVHDFELTRLAAYMVVMNGDPRKPEIAAAQAYFAVKTREAETRPSVDLTSAAGLIDLAQQFLETAKKLAAAETQLRVIEPKADAWDELASADGDYEVADAAKILARAGIETGRQRLFGQLEELGWIFRGAKGKWRAYQTAVDNGYLAEKPQSHYHPRTGELVLDPPQVRVTVRGLERLRARLANSKELVG